MAGLIQDDTDLEMTRYNEAAHIKQYSGLSANTMRGGTVRYDPIRKVDEVYVDLPSGGKLRVGDRPVQTAQADILTTQTDATAAAPAALVPTATPAPVSLRPTAAPVAARQPIAEYAAEQRTISDNGPTAADFETAGYTAEELAQYQQSLLGPEMVPIKMTPDQIAEYAKQPDARLISDYEQPGFFDGTVSETIKSLVRGGILDPVKFVTDLAGETNRTLFQIVDPQTGEFDPQIRIVSAEEMANIMKMPFAPVGLEDMFKTSEEAGAGAKFVGNVGQFVGAFAGLGKFFKIGKGYMANATRAGAADYLGFQGDSGRASDFGADLLLHLGVPENKVFEFMRTDPNDPDYIGRFKNALEGFFLGGLVDVIGPAFRLIKEGGSTAKLGQAFENLRFKAKQVAANSLSDAMGVGRAVAAGDTRMLGEIFQPAGTPRSLGAAAPTDLETAPEYLQQIGVEVPPSRGGLPGRISTRLPTAAKATEDPMTGELIIGYDELKADPKVFEPNVNIVREYPNMRPQPDATTDETAEQFIAHVKDNLLYLYDQVPEATRVRSQLWYDGARAITDRWSKEYGVADTGVAGALAALSPQKDWYQNVSLAQRVLNVVKSKGNNPSVFSPEMEQTFRRLESLNKPKYEPLLDAIKGKSYDEIIDPDPAVQNALRALFVRLHDQTYSLPEYKIVGPEGDFLDIARNADGSASRVAWGSLNEIGKAIGAIEANGDVKTISRLMGERHKVRNFYNNIYDPNSPYGDVTIDTHAVAAGLLRPLSGNSLEVDHNFKNMSVAGRGTTKGSAVSGVSGNYGLYAEAYRRAAAERAILPRQMQSITWEAVRGLFPDTFKTAKNNADVDAIWTRYRNGEIEIDEARSLVSERAGGIRPPSWQQQ